MAREKSRPTIKEDKFYELEWQKRTSPAAKEFCERTESSRRNVMFQEQPWVKNFCSFSRRKRGRRAFLSPAFRIDPDNGKDCKIDEAVSTTFSFLLKDERIAFSSDRPYGLCTDDDLLTMDTFTWTYFFDFRDSLEEHTLYSTFIRIPTKNNMECC
ncbi:uncharacterized protein LOC112590511 [Harpegnathos saltator]|uniref:uncharacterized protein LOC112590511 n=1 Tax=Harpegnathos saltator TaxID=610380 RepID=UPI000DBEED25|nr:uncharacterized protein LOC112590511 [Harpegnathos saltator]